MLSPLFNSFFSNEVVNQINLGNFATNAMIDNKTPNWQFPGEPPTAKVCQANLEEGDPIEVLANATTPIEVKEPGFDFVYHPQVIPLLQWFEMGTTSTAIDGAFSFPDKTVLTHSALPCPQ